MAGIGTGPTTTVDRGTGIIIMVVPGGGMDPAGSGAHRSSEPLSPALSSQPRTTDTADTGTVDTDTPRTIPTPHRSPSLSRGGAPANMGGGSNVSP
jgi:hypothetical protein